MEIYFLFLLIFFLYKNMFGLFSKKQLSEIDITFILLLIKSVYYEDSKIIYFNIKHSCFNKL